MTETYLFYLSEFILHSESLSKRSSTLKSQNLEIRRFFAVLENTGPKFRNLIHRNNEHYGFRNSGQV
jgi:hypothetical protein